VSTGWKKGQKNDGTGSSKEEGKGSPPGGGKETEGRHKAHTKGEKNGATGVFTGIWWKNERINLQRKRKRNGKCLERKKEVDKFCQGENYVWSTRRQKGGTMEAGGTVTKNQKGGRNWESCRFKRKSKVGPRKNKNDDSNGRTFKRESQRYVVMGGGGP